MRRALGPPLAMLLSLAMPAVSLAHGSEAPPATLPDVLFAWRLDPLALIPLLAIGGVYAWAVRRVNAAHPGNPHPSHRSWLFGGGLIAIGVALVSSRELSSRRVEIAPRS